MEDVEDTIAVASFSFGGVGIAEAIILSICLGLHTFVAGTMGRVSLNHSSLSFSASCSTLSWFLMCCNLLLCDLDRLGGHHLGWVYLGSLILTSLALAS